jgi:hypothetical protein
MMLQHHLLPLSREIGQAVIYQKSELCYIGSGCFLSLYIHVFKLNHASREYKHINAQRYFHNAEQL